MVYWRSSIRFPQQSFLSGMSYDTSPYIYVIYTQKRFTSVRVLPMILCIPHFSSTYVLHPFLLKILFMSNHVLLFSMHFVTYMFYLYSCFSIFLLMIMFYISLCHIHVLYQVMFYVGLCFPRICVLFPILIFSLFPFFLTAIRSPYCNMHLNAVKSITGWQDLASEWHSNPTVKKENTDVQLCPAVGPDACTPDDRPGQPSLYPRHSLYQFYWNCYHGAGSRDSLISMLKQSCSGYTLFLQKNDTASHIY